MRAGRVWSGYQIPKGAGSIVTFDKKEGEKEVKIKSRVAMLPAWMQKELGGDVRKLFAPYPSRASESSSRKSRIFFLLGI